MYIVAFCNDFAKCQSLACDYLNKNVPRCIPSISLNEEDRYLHMLKSMRILNKPNLNEPWSANSWLISISYFSEHQRCRISDEEFSRRVHKYTLLRRNCREKADVLACSRQWDHYMSSSLLYYVAIDVT